MNALLFLEKKTSFWLKFYVEIYNRFSVSFSMGTIKCIFNTKWVDRFHEKLTSFQIFTYSHPPN